MKWIDKKCTSISNVICVILSYICCPVKYICGKCTQYFQRPYSLCFVVNFFILMTPALMLFVLLVQFCELINEIETLNVIFYITMISLIGNYTYTFHIYYLYQRHTIEQNKVKYTVRLYIKALLNYLFVQTKVGIFGVYLLLHTGFCVYAIHHLYTTSDYDQDSFTLPVLIVFLKYAVWSNLLFSGGHAVIYAILFLALLCRITNSCLCEMIYECCLTTSGKIIQHDAKEQTYLSKTLFVFNFFGFCDYEKELNIFEENITMKNEENTHL